MDIGSLAPSPAKTQFGYSFPTTPPTMSFGFGLGSQAAAFAGQSPFGFGNHSASTSTPNMEPNIEQLNSPSRDKRKPSDDAEGLEDRAKKQKRMADDGDDGDNATELERVFALLHDEVLSVDDARLIDPLSEHR